MSEQLERAGSKTESIEATVKMGVETISASLEDLLAQYADGSLAADELKRRLEESVGIVLETIDLMRK